MTSVSQAAARTATVPIALSAIADHIEENKLLAPHTITLPDRYSDKVVLFLHDFGSQRWLDSVQILDEKNEPARAGWMRTTVKVLIPCPLGDVTVHLRFVREAPLQVVTA